MIVHPRHKWTNYECRPNPGGDICRDLGYYRGFHVQGVSYYSTPYEQYFLESDPAKEFDALRKDAAGKGYSDILFNLGVAGNANGVWLLRGLQNKSSSSPDTIRNTTSLSVYILLGSREKPTDALLGNILDARRLVVSRYPGADRRIDTSQVNNPYLQQIFESSAFWNGRLLDEQPPVGNPELPPYPLSEGMRGVHVQSLQETLAYWGYYRHRVDGVYTSRTVDAVLELQADLADGGYFFYDVDGVYSDHLERAWMKYLDG